MALPLGRKTRKMTLLIFTSLRIRICLNCDWLCPMNLCSSWAPSLKSSAMMPSMISACWGCMASGWSQKLPKMKSELNWFLVNDSGCLNPFVISATSDFLNSDVISECLNLGRVRTVKINDRPINYFINKCILSNLQDIWESGFVHECRVLRRPPSPQWPGQSSRDVWGRFELDQDSQFEPPVSCEMWPWSSQVLCGRKPLLFCSLVHSQL